MPSIEAEIDKAKAKLSKARESVQRQEKILGMPGYGEKVSEAVREVERQKLKDAEAEVGNYEDTIRQFGGLAVGGGEENCVE